MNEHSHEKQPSRERGSSTDPVEYLREQVERLSAFELAPGILVGQEFTVPDIQGVTTLEGGPKLPWVAIERGGTGHGHSESGILKEGAQVKVIGLSKRYGVLCEYHPNTRALGTEVSEGSLFFLPVAVLKEWPIKIERDATEARRRSRVIDALMADYREATSEMDLLAESRNPKPKDTERDTDDRFSPPSGGYGNYRRW